MPKRRKRLAASLAVAFSATVAVARAEPSVVPAPSTAPCGPAQALEREPASEPLTWIASRIATETLMGTGVATAGFLMGPPITAAGCRRCLIAAGLAGANATFPIGVYWGGHVLDGEGSFWLTVAAPWLVSAGTFTAIAMDNNYDGSPAFEIGALGGAIAAPLSIALYELTHTIHRSHAPRVATGFRPSFAVAPEREGMTLHLAGRF